MTTITIHNEGTYANGHTYDRTETITVPEGTSVEDAVWETTGDSQPGNIGSIYEATIVASSDPSLVGQRFEWGD